MPCGNPDKHLVQPPAERVPSPIPGFPGIHLPQEQTEKVKEKEREKVPA